MFFSDFCKNRLMNRLIKKSQADSIRRIFSHPPDGVCEHYFHPPDCVKPRTQFLSLLTIYIHIMSCRSLAIENIQLAARRERYCRRRRISRPEVEGNSKESNNWRDGIATAMWDAYQLELAPRKLLILKFSFLLQ